MSNPAPEHERLTCARGATIIAVPVRQGPWRRLPLGPDRRPFQGTRRDTELDCPDWFPADVCDNVTRVWSGHARYWPAAASSFEVDQEMIVVNWGGQKVMFQYWIGPVRLSVVPRASAKLKQPIRASPSTAWCRRTSESQARSAAGRQRLPHLELAHDVGAAEHPDQLTVVEYRHLLEVVLSEQLDARRAPRMSAGDRLQAVSAAHDLETQVAVAARRAEP